MRKYLILTIVFALGITLSANAQDCPQKNNKQATAHQHHAKMSPAERAKKVSKALELTAQQEVELTKFYQKNQLERQQRKAELENIIGKENVKKMAQLKKQCTKGAKSKCDKGSKKKCSDSKSKCDKSAKKCSDSKSKCDKSAKKCSDSKSKCDKSAKKCSDSKSKCDKGSKKKCSDSKSKCDKSVKKCCSSSKK